MRPLSIALGIFGAIVGLTALVLSGQALTRLVRAGREELAAIRAVGGAPRSLVAAMPVGPVRKVEPARGLDVDVTVVVLGALAIAAALAVTVVIAAWADLPHRVAR